MNRNYHIVKKQKEAGVFLQLKLGACPLKEIQVRNEPEAAQAYPEPLMEQLSSAGWNPSTGLEVSRGRATGPASHAAE